MKDIDQIYGTIVLELVFPKEEIISAVVCDSSVLEIGSLLYPSFKTPCNPYAEVVRGLVALETEVRPKNIGFIRKCKEYRFLHIDYIKRRFKYGDGPDYYNMRTYAFMAIGGVIPHS